MSDCESSDSDWEGVEELNEQSCCIPVICLFCSNAFDSPEDVFQHCNTNHDLDFFSVCKNSSLDAVSYIKIINYIRLHATEASDFENLLLNPSCWESDTYMKPVQYDDPLLTFDIEGVLEEEPSINGIKKTDANINYKLEYSKLEQEISNMKLQLEDAWTRIESMKKTAKSIFYSENNLGSKSYDQSEEADNHYFSSYDHFGIHHEMLQDKIRTLAYHDAILNNKDIFMEKNVMDLGCGTAILSLFAAKAGASKVIAVDVSNVICQATDIVRENGYDKTIELVKGRVEDISISEEKVDVIISEWMGYFLLFEGMLDSVLYARDRYLAPGGHLLPDQCTLSLAAVSDIARYNNCVTFWNDVYGFKMSTMKKEMVNEANVEFVKNENLCSEPVIIKELDLMTCKIADTEFVSEFKLIMKRDCQVTALVGFFDCDFQKGLDHKVLLSTAPSSTPTHWKQTLFLLPQLVSVTAGDKVKCLLSCKKNRKEPRTLCIKIHFGDISHKYYLV